MTTKRRSRGETEIEKQKRIQLEHEQRTNPDYVPPKPQFKVKAKIGAIDRRTLRPFFLLTLTLGHAEWPERNKVTKLRPNLHLLFFRRIFPLIVLATIVLFFYLLCLKMGWICYFPDQ